MGIRIILTSAGAALLIALCYLLSGLASTSFLPMAGIALALFSSWLWRLRGTESTKTIELYGPAFITLTGICIGGLGRWVIYQKSSNDSNRTLPILDYFSGDFIALLLGLLTSAAVIFINRRRVVDRCHRCQNPLGKNPALCPRGGKHLVCRQCWLPERFRCKDCEELRTPLLTLETNEWWTERLGEKIRNGQCFFCRRKAGERDLRGCGRCTGVMCLRCWDLENGRCVKCAWIMPGLPEPIELFHAEFSGFHGN